MPDKRSEEEDRGFKVVDRRGRADEAPQAEDAPPPAGADQSSASDGRATSDSRGDQVLGPIDFSTFLVSLASSALIHLGDAPNPETNVQDVSLPHAQQTIDLLALLQEKTKGNLSDDEGKLLQALLRDLRLRFVAATKRGST